MKISTKGRYGLEAIVDLAIHSEHGCVSLKSISERCGISEAYIMQIFLVLRRAGIVESVRGSQGGYVLARDPSRITAGKVLTALEGPLAPVSCLAEPGKNACRRFKNCSTRELWETMMETITQAAENVTVEELVECYRQSAFMQEPEYYI